MQFRLIMNELVDGIYSSLAIFRIASDTSRFQAWLKQEHDKALDKKMLHGYKFFLETAFSTFFESLAEDKCFELPESYLFQRALSETFHIAKFPVDGPDKCEKAIFLKNIYQYYVPINQSKQLDELRTSIGHFKAKVSTPFLELLEPLIRTQRKGAVDEREYKRLLLIDNLFFLYNQINNNGPVAQQRALLKSYRIEEAKLESCFEGYKYCLQYLWNNVLTETEYRNSKVARLHETNSWKKYKMRNSARKNASAISKMLGEYFEIEEQTCLDAHFYWVQKEIVEPLEAKYGEEIMELKKHLKIKIPSTLNLKENFKHLFSRKCAREMTINLSQEEKIETQLYWFPVEIIDSRRTPMFNAVSAFITLLAGSVALRGSEDYFERIKVCRIVTSVGRNKNDYSYGLLLDTKASAGHYDIGWLLYYDCCGDYSGFSGSQYRRIEKAIGMYLKQGAIELRELKIRKSDLEKYVQERTDRNYGSINSHNIELEHIVTQKQKVTIGKYAELKGLVFELLCYYFAHSYYEKNKTCQVEWGGLKDGSVDLSLHTESKVMIVECKINIDNYEWDKIMASINDRLSRVNGKDVDYEFWVWFEPRRHKSALQSLGKDVKILGNGRRDSLPFLSLVNYNKLLDLINYQIVDYK